MVPENSLDPHRGIAAHEALGHVISVGGSQASVRLHAAALSDGAPETIPTVGRFLHIHSERAILVGVVTKITVAGGAARETPEEGAIAQVDLLGEIKAGRDGAYFQRGVSRYPMIGNPVRLITNRELRLIYEDSGRDTIQIGHLQQDGTIGACVNVHHMLSKHFALLGSSGVGKSSGVAVLLNEIMGARPDLRIFVIDPHNEYGRCFGGRARVLNPRNLDLPFWLFNFEEIVDVFFRGRPGVEEEVEILAEVIPLAKAKFAAEREASERAAIRKHEPKLGAYTLDTPVPYRLSDIVALIEERMGKLEKRTSWTKYNRLLTRIELVRNDPRYGFMFEKANLGGDTMAEVIGELFRLPANGQPMTVMQLAGFPAEVVDAVVSVVGRMAFEFGLWSDGALPLLFLCEEAHRYAPADRAIGFGPTRKAVSRIAKEGRKYGVFLGLVTQRPAELDTTIISQCSTILAMRMANDRDQAIVRAAVSDAAASLLAFVPSLGTREVFAFGEGVALPTRLHFKELPANLLPKSEAVGRDRLDPGQTIGADLLAEVIGRWRGATMRTGPEIELAGRGEKPGPLAHRGPAGLGMAGADQPRGAADIRRPPGGEAPLSGNAVHDSLRDLRSRLRTTGRG